MEPRDLVGLLPLRGEDQHRQLGIVRADLADHLEAAEAGQHDVDDDEVRLLGPGEGEPRLAVHGRPHDVALHPEVQLEAAEDRGVVLDDEDPLRHHGTSIAGRVMVNVAPFPRSLVTATLPPWPATMCFTIASPSPVPSMAFRRGSVPR